MEEAVPLFPTLDSIEQVLWPGMALAVFVASAILVDVMILLATRWHILDLPSRRSAHSLPTARAGGVPMVLVGALSCLAICYRWPETTVPVILGLILPSVAIAAVGFVDDIRPLRATLRLVVQIGVALVMVAVLGPISSVRFPGLGAFDFGSAAWPLSVVWVVGMINAWNFMDGSDGMAATGAVVVSAFFVSVGFLVSSPVLVLAAAFVGAAAAGFLVFNWPPARVFMGDVGSAWLGAMLAGLALMPDAVRGPEVFGALVMAMWPYVFDPFLTVIRRAVTGNNPLVPHREFLFHRLVRSGWSHLSVAMLYALLAAAGGVAGRLMISGGLPLEVRRWLPAVVPVLAAALVAFVEEQFRRAAAAAARAQAAATHGIPGP